MSSSVENLCRAVLPIAPVESLLTGMKKDPVLGIGGFSVVYGGENPITGSPWAWKVSTSYKTDASLREYKILKRLEGAPHTIEARELGKVAGKVALAMKRMECPDLFDLLEVDRKRFNADQLLSIARQGLEALVFYHEKGVIHADIKLENCFYDVKTDQLTIFDFGLAFLPEEETWSCRGTRECMAPEIFLDQPVNAGIDIWALGMMLFSLYVGFSMFDIDEELTGFQQRLQVLKMFYFQFGYPFWCYLANLKNKNDLCYSSVQLNYTFEVESFEEAGLKALSLPEALHRYKKGVPSNRQTWQSRIVHAALRKNEPEKTDQILALLEGCFTFGDRMTAEEGLAKFFPDSAKI